MNSPLPPDVSVQLPHGQLLGAANAAVKLTFSSWSSIARLKAGQMGALAEDYVEGKLQLEGTMRDIIHAVTKLLPGNPVETDTRWWQNLLRRAKSLAAHTLEKDAAQIQFHYDVSDDFYALWLDPRPSIHVPTTQTWPIRRSRWPARKKPSWITSAANFDSRPVIAFSTSVRAGAACCCGPPSTTGWMPPASRCLKTSMHMYRS